MRDLKDKIQTNLHRVMIKEDDASINCPMKNECQHSATCQRCNDFYYKCSIFRKENKAC